MQAYRQPDGIYLNRSAASRMSLTTCMHLDIHVSIIPVHASLAISLRQCVIIHVLASWLACLLASLHLWDVCVLRPQLLQQLTL